MNKNVIIGIIVVAVIAAGVWVATQKKQEPTDATTASTSSATTAPAAQQQTSAPVTDLKIEDLQVGTGAEATPGKAVTVHYTGTLTNGTKFDSSLDRNQPFTFVLGAGQVIQGWDKGVAGMKVGGKRRLTIPPQMGYGAAGAGGVIPPNATLIFEVQLLNVADNK